MQVVKCQNIRTKPVFKNGVYDGHKDVKCKNALLFLDHNSIIVHCKSCRGWIRVTLKDGKAEITTVNKEDLDFTREMRAEVKSYSINTSINYTEADDGKQK